MVTFLSETLFLVCNKPKYPRQIFYIENINIIQSLPTPTLFATPF